MLIEILTKEDLEHFRESLLKDLQKVPLNKGQLTKEWLKSVEVRKMLQISPGTLQNLRITGKLKFTKVGGTNFYKASDIADMMDAKQK